MATNGISNNVGSRPQLVPLGRAKTVYLIRHGEGWHNIGWEGNLDAHLTPNGWKQAAALKDHLRKLEPQLGIQVVVVSPLTRTLETASGIFGGDDLAADELSQETTLMRPTTAVDHEISARSGIALPKVPLVASELCRERICPNRCDRRRPLKDTKASFPGVQFGDEIAQVDNLWDSLSARATGEAWYTHGESLHDITTRCTAFLDFLRARPETVLAVVSHAEFLSQLLQLCGDSQEDPRHRSMFNNCEMRAFVMAAPYTPTPSAGKIAPVTPAPGAGETPDPTAFPGGYACLDCFE